MSDRPWWAPAIQWGVWLVIMSLVMAWLARGRLHPKLTRDGQALVHPRSTIIIGLVCAGLFLTIALLSALFPGKTGSPAITLFFVGFAALGLLMILEYRNGRHTLTEDGLQYGRMLGQTGALRWNEVRRLAYSESAKWFRIELADGRVVRVSAMLVGLPNFARAALDRVPSSAIDPTTHSVLEATASGNLPRIWG
jgi:Bacterial PH domain